jgi:F-type H+-transporting ATPase subunit a
MILFISVGFLFLVFMNFRIRANKINVLFIYNIFIEIKRIRMSFIKIILAMVIFLIFNYNRYIYYGVGVTINYGYVFLYSFAIVLFLWVLWSLNNLMSILSHYLPIGVGGILKVFIPLIELLGALIRPITLAIRLATNISCGHVVSLMFRFFVFNIRNYLVFLIRILLYGLYFIEFLVCVIQAYVF